MDFWLNAAQMNIENAKIWETQLMPIPGFRCEMIMAAVQCLNLIQWMHDAHVVGKAGVEEALFKTVEVEHTTIKKRV